MLVQSNGVAIAGSEVDYDGLQIRSTQLLGVSSDRRYSRFRYDARSRGRRESVCGCAGAVVAGTHGRRLPLGRRERRDELSTETDRDDKKKMGI
ncbi:MAG: hypothetical protein M3Q69_08165 [Acidobacteriota bacterium]|nr:hypothetical protein [Acidobacteriota bacterium]